MRFFLYSVLLCAYCLQTPLWANTLANEKQLQLDQKILLEDDVKSIDSLFKNMIVVQKKAFERKNKILLLTDLSFDFSDNPKTMYSSSFGAGYCLTDNLEFHLSVAPFFISKDRDVAVAVRQLRLENGQYAELNSPIPKLAVSGSVLWAFAYGKDAFGPYSITRSDTFLKFTYSQIKYEQGLSGTRLGIFVGKTFFISKYFNFRLSAGFARQTSFVSQKSQMTSIGLIEPGLVWFL